MKCKKCGSENVFTQQVQTGSRTKTKDKYYAKHHSLLWWLMIGWWWWMVVLFIDLFLAVCTCGISLFFRKKKNVGFSKGKSKTTMINKTIATCQGCGYSWNV